MFYNFFLRGFHFSSRFVLERIACLFVPRISSIFQDFPNFFPSRGTGWGGGLLPTPHLTGGLQGWNSRGKTAFGWNKVWWIFTFLLKVSIIRNSIIFRSDFIYLALRVGCDLEPPRNSFFSFNLVLELSPLAGRFSRGFPVSLWFFFLQPHSDLTAEI